MQECIVTFIAGSERAVYVIGVKSKVMGRTYSILAFYQ